MNRYIIRAIKSTILIFILIVMVFVLSFELGNASDNPISFKDLLLGSDLKSMAIFGVVFGMVCPLLGFVKRKVDTNHPLDEEKQEVIRLFADVRFEVSSDEDKKLVFRHRSPVARLMRLYEDRIEVDYSGNPIVLSGPRRDLDRLASRVQRLLQQEEKPM
jgi:hypothetical protein